VSANNNIPTSSSDFTSLTAVDATTRPYYIVNSAGLTIPAGTKKIIIAVPSGWNSFGSGITIINDASLPETYSLTTISNTIGSYTKNYFVHYYIPAVPFPAETKHIISVS
jgi:hypothetical protein